MAIIVKNNLVGWWILDENGQIRPCETENERREIVMDIERRRVGHTEMSPDIVVSTVFLSWDHNFEDGSNPLLFETMVMGGLCDGYMERYSTYDQARNGHARTVEMIERVQGYEKEKQKLRREIEVVKPPILANAQRKLRIFHKKER